MKIYYTKCRSCGGTIRESAKFCFNCGKQARPLPALWFSVLSALFVAYIVLDTCHLV